jgi:hypothetical protein
MFFEQDDDNDENEEPDNPDLGPDFEDTNNDEDGLLLKKFSLNYKK